MKRSVNKEILDQYIYDNGYGAALGFFGLTEKKAETILYGVEEKRKIFVYNDSVELLFSVIIDEQDEKTKTIFKSIAENYDYLKDYFCKKADLSVLNVNAETLEDKFHNALIKLIEDLIKFENRGENTTLEYIKSRLYFQTKTDRKKDSLSKRVNKIKELISE